MAFVIMLNTLDSDVLWQLIIFVLLITKK